MRQLLAVLLLGSGSAVAADPVLAFPTATLRLEITANGKTPEVAWGAFLDNMFDHFDRNGDGILSATEAARVFPLPLTGRRVAALDFAKLDADQDSTGTRAEFKTFYRTAGFTPIVMFVEPAPPETLALGEALIRALDRDGKRSATKLLRRLDEDEDEVLSASELLSTARGGAIPLAGLKLASSESADAVLRLPLWEKPTLAKASDRFQLTGDRLTLPNGVCVLRTTTGPSNLRTTRAFYLAQFKSLAGDKPAAKALFEDDPTAQGLASLFDAADRNGDAKLTRAELEAFFDLIAAGVNCRVVVTAQDRGRNLFDRFDINGDGRLDLGELTRGEGLDAKTIPASYRLSVGQGSVGESFGPVPLGTVMFPMPERMSALTGPRWFQAMDRNGDGFVSANEFLGSPELFAKLDTDRDGRISPKEAVNLVNPP